MSAQKFRCLRCDRVYVIDGPSVDGAGSCPSCAHVYVRWEWFASFKYPPKRKWQLWAWQRGPRGKGSGVWLTLPSTDSDAQAELFVRQCCPARAASADGGEVMRSGSGWFGWMSRR